MKTVGRVIVAGRVVIERQKTGCRVGKTGCVAKECFRTVGCIADAGPVAIERLITGGRIINAACEAEESLITLSCVTIWIASVRWR